MAVSHLAYAPFLGAPDTAPMPTDLRFPAPDGTVFQTRAALICTREGSGGQALLAVELDQEMSTEAVNFLNSWQVTNWVRMLPKVMDG